MQDAVRRNQPLVANKPVRLKFSGGSDFFVRAEPRLFAFVVGNLLRNACLYTDQGVISVLLDDRSVLVRDSGRGLPAAVLGMLADHSTGRALKGSEGTGLGPELVKRSCCHLGATLEVAASSGGGTTFIVTFPAI